MPITTGWLDDRKQIILMVYAGNYTWDDVYLAANAANNLASEVNNPVANIVDMRKAGGVPPNAASHTNRLRELRHKNIQLEVVVGASVFMKTLANVATTVFKVVDTKTPSQYVDTMQEALQLVESSLIKWDAQ